jgi:acetyl-CoA carboxylase carboxyl transferase subunit alpha
MPELKNRQFLDFEKPIKDLYDEIEAQKQVLKKARSMLVIPLPIGTKDHRNKKRINQ